MGEDAAAEVGATVSLHPARHALAVGIRRGGGCQEGLEMVLHNGVERRGRGVAAAVDGAERAVADGAVPWRGGSAPLLIPDPAIVVRG